MIKWLKQKFNEWFLDAMEHHNVVDETKLVDELDDAKQEVWDETVSKNTLDNLEYEVSHNEEAISDLSDDLDKVDDELREMIEQLEDTMEWFRNTIEEQRSKIKKIEEDQLEVLQHALYDMIIGMVADEDVEELGYLRAFKEWYEENYKTLREWHEASQENKE